MKKRSPLYVTSLIAGAFFMENLDGTIIAPALPQMAKSFHASAVSLNIGMTAYMLTLAVLIPISGWVADRFGARTVFSTAVAIFTLASLLCAGARTLPQFTLMRILQGVGGAMMVPVGRLIVLRETPKDRLAQAIAYISWPGLTALVVGPALGGFITTYSSWHWIFLMNVPLGVIAIILANLWIENKLSEERHGFDWGTFALAGAASAGSVYAMEKLGGGESGWTGPALVLSVSLLCGFFAILYARRRPSISLIDFESMRNKTYSLSIYGASAFRIGVSALPFLLPLMFQIAFQLSAFRSGLYLLALFGGDFSMKSIVIPLLRRFGFRRLLIVNGIITASTIGFCALLTPATPVVLLIAILFLHGASRSLEFTCLTTLAYAEIPSERMSRANGFLSAIMQLSTGMGVAVGAVTLRMVAMANHRAASHPALPDFRWAIAIMAIFALGPVFDSLGLPPHAGASTSGHKHQQEIEEAMAFDTSAH